MTNDIRKKIQRIIDELTILSNDDELHALEASRIDDAICELEHLI